MQVYMVVVDAKHEIKLSEEGKFSFETTSCFLGIKFENALLFYLCEIQNLLPKLRSNVIH